MIFSAKKRRLFLILPMLLLVLSACQNFPLAEVVQDESFAEEISIFNDKDVEK